MSRSQTPSQTVGPFFSFGLTPEQYGYPFAGIIGNALANPTTPGELIRIRGQVFDGEATPVRDALIEIWQADAAGRYLDASGRNDGFSGFGRCGTGAGDDDRYAFTTIKPGSLGTNQAPHVNLIVFMRGLLRHVHTRMYFPDEPANEHDEVLQSVSENRRGTLIARNDDDEQGPAYRFDVHMQGTRETVFFDL